MTVVPLAEDEVAAIRIPERHPSSLSCGELCRPCSLCLSNLPGIILTTVILLNHRLSLPVREVQSLIRFVEGVHYAPPCRGSGGLVRT